MLGGVSSGRTKILLQDSKIVEFFFINNITKARGVRFDKVVRGRDDYDSSVIESEKAFDYLSCVSNATKYVIGV